MTIRVNFHGPCLTITLHTCACGVKIRDKITLVVPFDIDKVRDPVNTLMKNNEYRL